MSRWREHKARALGNVHEHFEVPAVYLTHPAGTPHRLMVRVHTRQSRIENEFTFPNTPGFLDLEPTIIFRASDVDGIVYQDAFVFVGPSEVYRTGPSRPVRDGYIPVEVTDASSDDIASVDAVFSVSGYGDEWEDIFP